MSPCPLSIFTWFVSQKTQSKCLKPKIHGKNLPQSLPITSILFQSSLFCLPSFRLHTSPINIHRDSPHVPPGLHTGSQLIMAPRWPLNFPAVNLTSSPPTVQWRNEFTPSLGIRHRWILFKGMLGWLFVHVSFWRDRFHLHVDWLQAKWLEFGKQWPVECYKDWDEKCFLFRKFWSRTYSYGIVSFCSYTLHTLF